MNFTNVTNLPETYARAAIAGVRRPTPGRISATALSLPPQLRALELAHWDEITEDVSDRLWALLGASVHAILEAGAGPDEFVEEVLISTLETDEGDVQISGRPDLWAEPGVITDWKICSVWSIMDGAKEEWCQQLNAYAYLFRDHNCPVSALRVVALLRDWSKLRARRESDYPQSGVVTLDIPVWPEEQLRAWLRKRIALHRAAERGDYAPCTDEERWARPTTYAVMKAGRKSALRVLPDIASANRWVSDYANGPGAKLKLSDLTVEQRPGDAVRCREYCRAAPFCAQWQAELAAEAAA